MVNINKVALLEKINEKLTHLGWITAQIAGERNLRTIYHIIVNGFEQITGVSRCGFMKWEYGGYKPVVVKNCSVKNKSALCDGLFQAFNAVLKERVKIVSAIPETGYLFKCCDGNLAQFNVCTIYKSNGKPFGVLFACGPSDMPNDTLFMIMELYAMQAGLILENTILNHKLVNLAITDSLTGLYNHRYFYECIEKECGDAQKRSMPLSLLFIDVDHFKRYNDTYGHLEGDLALASIAKTIKDTVGSTGSCFRFGGEEIAVILPGVPTARGVGLGWDICRAISNSDGYQKTITVSVGVATRDMDMTAQELIGLADEALYRAKAQGRNQVCLAGDELIGRRHGKGFHG